VKRLFYSKEWMKLLYLKMFLLFKMNNKVKILPFRHHLKTAYSGHPAFCYRSVPQAICGGKFLCFHNISSAPWIFTGKYIFTQCNYTIYYLIFRNLNSLHIGSSSVVLFNTCYYFYMPALLYFKNLYVNIYLWPCIFPYSLLGWDIFCCAAS
jgi:hypothetical protein